MRNKWIAALLAAALTVSLLILPAAAAPFPDVTDPKVADAVDLLKELGVIGGRPNGTFDPSGTLTRAEFCKMALVALGRDGEATLQQSRVIFNDVTAAHWALGYVNAAATPPANGVPLVQGIGDGRFLPDQPITFGQAVTVLMRSLGYSDKDVPHGGSVYAGHILRATQIGLLDGISLTADSAITRAQAALLFENLLFTAPKDSAEPFISAVLGGSVTQPELILSVDEPLMSGGRAVRTASGKYATGRADFDASLPGTMGRLVLTKNKSVLAILPAEGYITRTLRIVSAESRYVMAGSERLLVDGDVTLWRADGTNGRYSDLFTSIRYGTDAVFCMDQAENLLSIFLTSGGTNTVTAIAAAGSAPFAAIVGGSSVTVYKNGAPAAMKDVRQYDVGTYDSAAGVLRVSDRKLTGIYEGASPSLASPDKIKVLGAWFNVLPCALADLSGFKSGEAVTLLLDGDSQVAGVAAPKDCTARAIGVASYQAGNAEDSPYSVTVTLAFPDADGKAVKVQGVATASLASAASAPGRLVTVYATDTARVDGAAKSRLTISALSGVPVPGGWDVAKGTVGNLTLAGDAALYDQVSGGPLHAITRADVTVAAVAAKDIVFLHTNAAGQVDAMVLNNVTGDVFTYGVVGYTPASGTGMDYQNPEVLVRNGAGAGPSLVCNGNYAKLEGSFLGLAAALPTASGTVKLAQHAELTALTVRRAAFGDGAVTVDGVRYPLAANIEHCCYNRTSKEWFAGLKDALAYSELLTVYFDRLPGQGGKIRLVAAG